MKTETTETLLPLEALYCTCTEMQCICSSSGERLMYVSESPEIWLHVGFGIWVSPIPIIPLRPLRVVIRFLARLGRLVCEGMNV